MGRRVILATIIVGVTLMMLFSAVMPAMADPPPGTPGNPPPKDSAFCVDLFNKLIDAGIDPGKIINILAKMGCL